MTIPFRKSSSFGYSLRAIWCFWPLRRGAAAGPWRMGCSRPRATRFRLHGEQGGFMEKQGSGRDDAVQGDAWLKALIQASSTPTKARRRADAGGVERPNQAHRCYFPIATTDLLQGEIANEHDLKGKVLAISSQARCRLARRRT